MSVTNRFKDRLIARDGFTCHYCGLLLDNIEYAADHIVPRVKGGRDILENLVLACKRCNSRKRDRDYAAFKEWAAANPIPAPIPRVEPLPTTVTSRIIRQRRTWIDLDARVVTEYLPRLGSNGLAVYLALLCSDTQRLDQIAPLVGIRPEHVEVLLQRLHDLRLITIQETEAGRKVILEPLPEDEAA